VSSTACRGPSGFVPAHGGHDLPAGRCRFGGVSVRLGGTRLDAGFFSTAGGAAAGASESRHGGCAEISATCGVWAGGASQTFRVGAALFHFFAQDGPGRRIHVVDLAAYGAGHRLIDVVVLRDALGNEALNALSG
jgi:hypothetical protein